MSLDLEGREGEHFKEDDDEIGQEKNKFTKGNPTYSDICKLDCASRDWIPNHDTFIFLLGLVLQEDIHPWPTRKAHLVLSLCQKKAEADDATNINEGSSF